MGEQLPGAPLHHRAEFERARRGWGKAELAQHAGIGRTTYDRLATNTTPPIASTVRGLCQALDIDLAEGLRLSGLDAPTPPVPAGLVDELRRRLPDVDDVVLARVLTHTADILISAANGLGRREDEQELCDHLGIDENGQWRDDG